MVFSIIVNVMFANDTVTSFIGVGIFNMEFLHLNEGNSYMGRERIIPTLDMGLDARCWCVLVIIVSLVYRILIVEFSIDLGGQEFYVVGYLGDLQFLQCKGSTGLS